MTNGIPKEFESEKLMTLLHSRESHFRFESGHHGDRWFELDALFLHPARLKPFILELASRLSKHNLDAICGPLIGGAFIGEMIASVLDIEFYYSERLVAHKNTALYSVQYKIPNALRHYLRGKKVAIVDDVISAGSAVRATFNDLCDCQANPTVLAALMLKGSAISTFVTENQLLLESIICVPDNLWLPTDCPLCVSGIPLEEISA